MNAETPVRFGVLGARSWIFEVAVGPAIAETADAELVAVGAAGGPVPTELAPLDRGGYAEVLADDRVEAVYLPLANGLHREWVLAAVEAGKHVLCEKPLGNTADEAAELLDVGARAGVLVAEAWMTPFDRRWRQAINLAANGGLGEIEHIDTRFTFTIDRGNGNYRWRADQGGGSLLDVGIYCLGPVVALLGAEPASIAASAVMTDDPFGPVDARTEATLDFGGGRTAHIVTSFQDAEEQRLEIVGSTGTLVLDGDAHTGGPNAIDIHLTGPGGETNRLTTDGGAPYRGMVDAFAASVRGREPWPRPAGDVIALAHLLDRVRAAAAPR